METDFFHRLGFSDVSVPNQGIMARSKAPLPRRVWNPVPRFPENAAGISSLRFDLATPLCRRTPKQSEIHKEPWLNGNRQELIPRHSGIDINSLFPGALMETFMNLMKKQSLWYIRRFDVLKHGDSLSTTC